MPFLTAARGINGLRFNPLMPAADIDVFECFHDNIFTRAFDGNF